MGFFLRPRQKYIHLLEFWPLQLPKNPGAGPGFCSWGGGGGGALATGGLDVSMVRRMPTALSENFKFWSQLGGGFT